MNPNDPAAPGGTQDSFDVFMSRWPGVEKMSGTMICNMRTAWGEAIKWSRSETERRVNQIAYLGIDKRVASMKNDEPATMHEDQHKECERAEAAKRQIAEARKDYHEIKRELSLTQAELAEAQNTLSAALFQLEQVRKDAERYRWLRNLVNAGDDDPHVVEFDDFGAGWLVGETLDAAIDAALASKGKA